MFAQLTPLYIKTRPYKALTRTVSYAFFEGRPLFTKGRWINPLVFFHLGIEKKLPIPKKVEQPVFIVGMGRSGTTVLGTVMSMHKDIGFLNEPRALWHSICPMEDVNGHFGAGPACYRMDESHVTDVMKIQAHRLFGAYLAMVFSNRLAVKHPTSIFRVPFIKAIFPDARFIFIARSGWGTCRSVVEWCQAFGRTGHHLIYDWWGINRRKWHLMLEQLVPGDDVLSGIGDRLASIDNVRDMAAVEWVLTMREGLRQKARYPDDIHLIRYEELMANPGKTLLNAGRFCNLPQDEVFLSFATRLLKPGAPPRPFAMNGLVQQAFFRTMSELGYQTP